MFSNGAETESLYTGPEAMKGVGKAAPYKQVRCVNLARKGLIALNVDWVGMGQLRVIPPPEAIGGCFRRLQLLV